MRQKISGEEHDTVAVSYGNLGIICLDLGQFIEAKEYLEKALIIQKKIYGEEHTNVATSYNNLALVCRGLRENNKAKEQYKKAVSIKEKIFHEENAEEADINGHSRVVGVEVGYYSEAKEYQENRAQLIRKKTGVPEYCIFAKVAMYNNIGFLTFHEHNFEDALTTELADVDSNLSQCEQSRRKCCILI